jgi:O-methyltransferase involved in polyketide biosynthesis
MYLKDDEQDALFASLGKTAAPGSVVAGDTYVMGGEKKTEKERDRKWNFRFEKKKKLIINIKKTQVHIPGRTGTQGDQGPAPQLAPDRPPHEPPRKERVQGRAARAVIVRRAQVRGAGTPNLG